MDFLNNRPKITDIDFCNNPNDEFELFDTDAPEAANFQNLSLENEMKDLSMNSDNKSSQQKVSLDHFDVIKLIGSGGYGKVYLVKNKKTSKHYAMKALQKSSIVNHERHINFAKTERAILEIVKHPFIVSLHYAFQSKSRLYLIMDYVNGGELFYHMSKERIFSELQASFYSAEIVIAINHLHNNGIIYRDLKPENILLSANGHLKITDFGLSKLQLNFQNSDFSQSDPNNPFKTNTFCGTPSYMAPEIFDLQKPYEKSVDWWSLGILIYEMLTGKVPYKGKSHKQVYETILKKKIVFPNYLSTDSSNIIRKLLKKSPEQRLGFGSSGFENIKKQKFFSGINWKNMLLNSESITPPIIPVVNSESDYSNFDLTFTAQPISLFSNANALQKMQNLALLAENNAVPSPIIPNNDANLNNNYTDNSFLNNSDINYNKNNNNQHIDPNLSPAIIPIPIKTNLKKTDSKKHLQHNDSQNTTQNPEFSATPNFVNNIPSPQSYNSDSSLNKNSDNVFFGFSFVAKSSIND
ncbi:Ribosomal protein S6 kinase beta-2 [Smittium culicis]|uniref:Ribosomal protein S6 kinase beta-2 n=1 Tax=Smittium culicis TaxID=133412 RepID=A0A1R1WYU9_9FUNG|nr:Ribosomal protein S6 kinase beta-2 [Smittium culicis]